MNGHTGYRITKMVAMKSTAVTPETMKTDLTISLQLSEHQKVKPV